MEWSWHEMDWRSDAQSKQCSTVFIARVLSFNDLISLSFLIDFHWFVHFGLLITGRFSWVHFPVYGAILETLTFLCLGTSVWLGPHTVLCMYKLFKTSRRRAYYSLGNSGLILRVNYYFWELCFIPNIRMFISSYIWFKRYRYIYLTECKMDIFCCT